MPCDFSRSVSHESRIFQSVLIHQQAKNPTRVSSGCDEVLGSSLENTRDCVSVSSLLEREGSCQGDYREPESRLFDNQILKGASQGLVARENSELDETNVIKPSVNEVLSVPQHNDLLFISKPVRSTPDKGVGLSHKKILLIGCHLVTSKSEASHKYSDINTEVSKKAALPIVFSDSNLTIQKIEYKCRVLQEHCHECKCDAPRLHVYLTRGHQCSGKCNLTEPSTNASDQSFRPSSDTEMTGKMKAKCRSRKSNSFKFSDNLVKVEASGDDARMSVKPSQAKKKKLSLEDKNKQEPESELLGEAECVWLPTIMSTLSGDVEYVVLDDDVLNLGAKETSTPPQSLKSKINNIYEDIDEKPLTQNIIATSPKDKPTRTRLPPLRRLSEVNLACTGVKDVGQTGDTTAFRKTGEESRTDDPCNSSLAEVCTNLCPSIKDIFGDVSVKEEPVEYVKQDMTVDDFSKEILKTSSKESSNMSCARVQKQGEKADDGYEAEEGSGKGLFAKLIKEESNANEEEVNSDAHNSDDSLGPLQIDEKYSPSPEDSCLALAKDVVELNMPSVNIISPFKIKILLGSPNREAHQGQIVEPTPQVGPSGTIIGKVLEVSNVVTAAKKVRPIKPTTPNSAVTGDPAPAPVTAPDSIQNLTCIYCHTSCPNAQALAEHFENHQKDGLIICYFCQKSFGDKTGMKRHMRTHTGEKPYQCKICGKRFSLPGNFKKHRDIHEDKRTEPCSVCGKTFRRKEHLKYHMRTHTGEKPFSCNECGACFTARYSLQIHMNIHLGKKPYKCTYCSKAFSDKSTMRKHVRVHTGEKPFRCQECWRCFGESGTLAAHMATHRNDRPFNCDKCDLRFKTTGGLRQHEKVHTGEKQFACKFCGMKFLQKYNMTMHERIHTGEKPYTCSHCQRSFRSRSCLAKHVVLHGGEDERRFGCDHCNSRFYRKAHLRRHIDMHLGVKNYECEYCQKKFCTRGTLRSHFKTFHSTGARRFPCNRCGRVFKRKVYVNTHLCANTAYKVVNGEDKPTRAPSEGLMNETSQSNDSEDLSFEVKSEPEDTVVEEKANDDVHDSQLDLATNIMSQAVKMEWDAQN